MHKIHNENTWWKEATVIAGVKDKKPAYLVGFGKCKMILPDKMAEGYMAEKGMIFATMEDGLWSFKVYGPGKILCQIPEIDDDPMSDDWVDNVWAEENGHNYPVDYIACYMIEDVAERLLRNKPWNVAQESWR